MHSFIKIVLLQNPSVLESPQGTVNEGAQQNMAKVNNVNFAIM
jgi:hypothetical protein